MNAISGNDMNIAEALDVVAKLRGDADSLIQGDRVLSWREVERRAGNVAAWMKQRGVTHQSKLSLYTYNHPAYMEGVYAAFKAAMVPVNVNYRYREEELRYLLDDSDSEIVIAHEEFVPRLRKVLPELPQVRGVLVVAERGGKADLAGLPSAEYYEHIAENGCLAPEVAPKVAPEVTRSGNDLMFLYTGGTTGMPKGVMWRQGDIFARLGGGGVAPAAADLDSYRDFVAQQTAPPRLVVGPPLMHGTGWFTAMIAWLGGGCVITLAGTRGFDSSEMLHTIEKRTATGVTIVGDPFARPLVHELARARDEGHPYDIGSVVMIMSSGVMWSRETKQALLEANPKLVLVDAFSSSEALGMGTSVTTAAGQVGTGKFVLSPSTRLFDAELRPLESAPGVRGMVGVGGAQPLGYYKDPEKTARTFVEVEGQRYVVPGDWAQIEEDGISLQLLGRGSVCINTGGEKVFPEEVEEVIKRFDGVKDSVVVGLPDERWGEAITAVVSTHGPELDEPALVAHLKAQLASYKCPKQIVHVDEVYRSPSGKADFARTRETAMRALGLSSAGD